jgi:cytochrome P450
VTSCEAFPFDILPSDYGSTTSHYQQRRNECPIGLVTMPSGDRAWLLVGYDDVEAALRSRSLSRNLRAPSAPRIFAGLDMSANPNLMINLDPPSHTRLRQLVQVAFNISNVKAWQPAIRHLAERLIDDLVANGPAQDLVTSFTRPLAIGVMCEVLGVPSADRQAFTGWSESFFSTAPAEERMASGSEFLRYVRDLIRTCRANPKNGLIDALISARTTATG